MILLLDQPENFRLQISDIVFAGELKGSRLAEMVRGAGLFVLPSDLERLPLAMLEAMREGIPVLASDIPPHQQLIGSDRGMLFNSGSIISCAMALKQGMLNPQKLAVMGAKAQDHVRVNYNWSKITAANLAVYGQNLTNNPDAKSKQAKASAKV